MSSSPREPDVVVIPAGDALLGDPPRTEHVNVFAIARGPITNREYERFVADAAFAPPPAWGLPEHPIEGVSWADAVAYCRWLTRGTGHIYRLPDEREWEKTARATSGRAWPWGEEAAVALANVREAGIGGTSAVGAFAAGNTPEGVADLVGNVREWTNSWVNGRVLRGGSYRDRLAECAPARRLYAKELLGVGFRVVRSMTGR